MNSAIQASELGKQYRRTWALRDCTLAIPEGHVAGLVGPNGAGKTTLLKLATGMLTPTLGTITVLGQRPGAGPAQMARVSFVAQDTPVYSQMTVADHLRLGAWLNPGWDNHLARQRISQLALTLAMAKRPELIILDEPVASLDPLARREFLQALMEAVAGQSLSVMLSSHLVADLERVCDYLVLLVASQVQVAGEVGDLLASHHRLSGPRRDPATLPADQEIITQRHTDKQTSLLVRTDGPVLDPAWTVMPASLEDVVLAYMSRTAGDNGLASPQRLKVVS